ncbi:hypothetical protein LCGC14_0395260 [marine sediment metagenome]|uniref:Uncharacterized protein n=1 Tax=marine sediment metagenome TaxID=412755 RepID=A0A0F9VKC7_9ZZZZ
MVDKKDKIHPFASKDGKTIDMNKMHTWVEKNVSWLTEWLTNVVTMEKAGMDKSTVTFQTFQIQLTNPPPLGIIQAGNAIKVLLIQQCITGRRAINPPQFQGFYQAVGRLPKNGDSILFTAIEWFKLNYIAGSNIMLAENSSIPKVAILRTTCAVNYIVQK